MTFSPLPPRQPDGPLEAFVDSLHEPAAITAPRSASGWAAVADWGDDLSQRLIRDGGAADPERRGLTAYLGLTALLAGVMSDVLFVPPAPATVAQ